MDLAGKAAVVTGSSKGIGRALALALAEKGARVLVNSHRSAREGAAVVREIRAKGGQAAFAKADVTREAEVRRLLSRADKAFGGLHLLVNNAGCDAHRRIEDVDARLLDWIVDTNLKASFLATRHAIPFMRRSGGGVVVNVSSRLGFEAVEEAAAYCAAKAGLNHFTLVAARELSRDGIRVCAVLPLTTETDLLRAVLPAREIARMRADGKVGTLEEAVGLILRAVADDSLSGRILVDNRITRPESPIG